MSLVPQFIDNIRRSGLVESAKLDEALAVIDSEYETDNLDDPAFIADQLVHQYVLTAWQSRQLLKGRYKGFFLRQYKILGHLGSGGMSSVFLAEHILMQRRVAVKVLPRKRLEKAIYLERFIREAQAIAALDHPNIIRAYDFDNEGDIHYIIMEYFPAENLQTIVEKDKKVPFPRIVNILRQTADALSHAHAIGVVHRDVKPSNILVNQQGEVKVLDLGLALLDEQVYEGRISHIQEDTILGTADYLAPEQALDSHKVDARADIYALGGVLYFCLTGHPPFPEGSVSKRLLDHQQSEPASILIDRPDAPEDLVALCQKMMSKNPEHRQQSAREVVQDFEDWLVRNGYAEEGEFADSGTGTGKFRVRVNTQKIVKPDSLQLLQQQKEREADQAEEAWLDSTVLGATEESINLLGSEVGSAMISLSVLSAPLRDSSGAETAKDSAIAKLNNIERERTMRFRREAAHLISDRAAQKKASLVETQLMPAVAIPSQETEGFDWYRHVPVWFWTLFLSGYVAAVFLAGILAALLMVFFGPSRQ
ncbi:MAG: serine/threonine protein kinase [Planctomycetaceae bacterium]|nr:serine/threonine protein kinase [Planctomycetaceae bacterium]